MILEVHHSTRYEYPTPVAEAYVETRLTPPQEATQTVREHTIEIDPGASLYHYTDFLQNKTGFFSIPHRHESLSISNRLVVETHAAPPPAASMKCPVQEARQIIQSMLPDVYPFLQMTAAVQGHPKSLAWGRRWFRPSTPLGPALLKINSEVHKQLRYKQGSTTIYTPIEKIWKQRSGVCQDFSHLLLSILRMAGLPARYVCGYIDPLPIEADQMSGAKKESLVGALATHAWVEVFLPGKFWLPLDPTNDCLADSRYVAVARGRDFYEAAPVRGTFKGGGNQDMEVNVTVKRLRS